MRGQALLAVSALAAALMAAQPASAQDYRQNGQGYSSYHDEHVDQSVRCEQARANNTTGGAIIGAILGAVVGSHAAANHHASDGALVGAAAGGLVGGAIGHDSTRTQCDPRVQGAYDPYYGQPVGQGRQDYGRQDYGRQAYAPPQPQYDPRYQRGDDGRLLGGQYDRSSYNNRSRRRDDCRVGEIVTRDPDGYARRENVWMCRGRDGVWRPSQGY